MHKIHDSGSAALLVSFHTSAAFDCIEHNILLNILHEDFGISGTALAWIESFLTCRAQRGCDCGAITGVTVCACGVPQGSVLGPVLFNLYTSPLAMVIDKQGASHSQFADDAIIYAAIDQKMFKPLPLQCCGSWFSARLVCGQWIATSSKLVHSNQSRTKTATRKIQLACICCDCRYCHQMGK